MENYFSISPHGQQFPLPEKNEYPAEFNRIKVLADKARSEGKEIVVFKVDEGVVVDFLYFSRVQAAVPVGVVRVDGVGAEKLVEFPFEPEACKPVLFPHKLGRTRHEKVGMRGKSGGGAQQQAGEGCAHRECLHRITIP